MSVPSGRDLLSCFFKGLRSKRAAKIWLILGRSDLIVASMLELTASDCSCSLLILRFQAEVR